MKPLVLAPRGLASLALPLVVALVAPVASAASSSAAPADAAAAASAPAQRTRMKTCNADAKGKHGEERKAFMKQCLSRKGAASAAS